MNTSISNTEWCLQAIHAFRPMGFFKQYATQTDCELIRTIGQLHRDLWREELDPADPQADLLLLSSDKERVWWDDTEADVCAENEVYEKVLREWSEISLGAFVPENVQEQWQTDKGPIEVRFTHRGKQAILTPRYLDDYIDMGILTPINRLIRSTGVQFAVHAAFDQSAFVVVLKADDKRKLQAERGWRFAKL